MKTGLKKLGFVILALIGAGLSLTRALGDSYGARILSMLIMVIGFFGYFHFSEDKK